MILKELSIKLDRVFHREIAADWDNAGTILGRENSQVSKVLIALDITGSVIKEAIELGADLIISHHPLILSPLKSIGDHRMQGRAIMELIENKIAVYSAHTNLDAIPGGINELIAKIIGLEDLKIIEPLKQQWYKFVVFVPASHERAVREAICDSGGGRLGDYSCCTFNIKGIGTFKPGEKADPFTGRTGELNFIDEIRIECIIDSSNLGDLVDSVLKVHPYEEPAYDIYRIESDLSGYGMGRVGCFNKALPADKIMEKIINALGLRNLRWMDSDKILSGKMIKNAAVINGSANSIVPLLLLPDFLCDMVIVGELKHHNVLGLIADGKFIVELGHGESEMLAIDAIHDILLKNFKDIEIIKSKNSCNLWRYYIE